MNKYAARRPYRNAVAALLAGAMMLETSIDTVAEERHIRQIEEVLVTARRIEESLQDTPVSVTAFSRSDLEQIGASEPKDIAQHTPNLTIRNAPATNDDYAFSLRGVAAAEPALAIDPAVGLYVDGIYIARNAGMAFDIVDMQRIEVLRGPQGTLFGRNTIGGAVNIITEKPRGEFAYDVQLGFGNRDHQRQRVTLDTPTFGNWAAKLSFLNTEREGWLTSDYGGSLGGQKNRAWRAALRWTATEAFTLDYTFTYTDREGNGQTSQLTHVRPIYADPDGEFYGGPFYEQAAASASRHRLGRLAMENTRSDDTNSRIDAHTLTLTWEVTEHLLIRSISSYRDWWDSGLPEFNSFPVQSEGDVLDGRKLETDGEISIVPAGTLVPLFRSPRDREQEQWTQEFQFIGTLFEERLHYNAGFYYFDETGFEDSSEQTFVLPTSVIADFAAADFGFPSEVAGILSSVTTSQGLASTTMLLRPFLYAIENRAYAVYGDFTWRFTHQFEITLGARYTVDERSVRLQNMFDGETRIIDVDDKWSDFSPSITLDYRWSPEINTYFKIASGYRSGGFNVRAITESAFREPFDPEKLISFEAGVKSDLLDRRLRLNAAVFHFLYEDRQIAQFEAGTGGASSKIVNAGKSETRGLEIDAVYIPTANIRLLGSYGFLDVEHKEFVTGPLDPVTGFPAEPGNRDISGEADTRLFAPRHTASLAAEYQFHPWTWGQLLLRADVNYTGAIAFHPQLSMFDSSGAHTLYNARATLSDIPLGQGNLQFALWGKNLGNEKYRDFGIDFSILGFTVNTFAPLRSYGVDLVYRFNR